MIFRIFRKRKKSNVSFEEILLDSSNLPSFNTGRLEGRMELPLSERSIMSVGILFGIIVVIFLSQLFFLQISNGDIFAEKSEKNRLEETLIIAERGVVYDRNGERIAWNELDTTGKYNFPVRAYTDRRGFGQVIGYVQYPQKDKQGFYFRTEYIGRNGIEEAYNDILSGKNGKQIIEVNVYNEHIARNVIDSPIQGKEITTSLDAELSEVMHDLIATTTEKNNFRSGAGAIMNVQTGEIIALASFPSYDPEVLSDGDDIKRIEQYNDDKRYPFLNKIIAGMYVPGSIVKPFVAYGALAEDIISKHTRIVSKGQIVIPNLYTPNQPAIYRDWRQSLGEMTVRDAIAYSSNVFMMTIGGGYENQKGLGISKLASYYSLFGLGSTTGVELAGEQKGLVPTPEWKEKIFNDEWRLGDTYLTSIGQFGFQATPIQMLRAYAALANGGYLVTPHFMKDKQGEKKDLSLISEDLKVVQDGMRSAVIQDGGTARALERDDVAIAAKSGTAELGASKATVNSWIAGFFPYEKPTYAFILFMENGPRTNMVGASSVMGQVFNWISDNRPHYIQE
jgi:penicillin-binding protein 2